MITFNSKRTSLENVKAWAAEFWGNVIDPWLQRPPQDYVYRHHVVEPAITRLISECDFRPLSLVAEIGCGDGAHTVFWRQRLNDLGLENVIVVGVDLLKPLLFQARRNTLNHDNVSFIAGDVTRSTTADVIHKEVGTPDIIVAMFLLQDIPDLIGLLEMVKACLREGGHFVSVLVHPDFAERLKKAKLILRPTKQNMGQEYITESGLVQWRFIGHYPIARENSPPFYLPYFHRTLADYYKVFDYFDFEVIGKIPLGPDLELCHENSCPGEPFCESRWNVYWPYIMTGPSSMLIHAVKRRSDSQCHDKDFCIENRSLVGPNRTYALSSNHFRGIRQ